jgi:hypothetical protein
MREKKQIKKSVSAEMPGVQWRNRNRQQGLTPDIFFMNQM